MHHWNLFGQIFCQGLNDLREGIIRTPLPPKETFLDDPLRVLRCVRFASRLGFEIVSEAKDAARDRIVQESLPLSMDTLCFMFTIASLDRKSFEGTSGR